MSQYNTTIPKLSNNTYADITVAIMAAHILFCAQEFSKHCIKNIHQHKAFGPKANKKKHKTQKLQQQLRHQS